MKVRFLMASERESGAAKPVVELALGLQHAGCQVQFSCKAVREWSRKPLAAYAAARGLSVDTTLAMNNRVSPIELWRDVACLAEQLRRDPVDVLHCSYRMDHWIGALAARRSGNPVRVIRSRHHSVAERADPLHRWCYQKLTHGVIEVCDATRQRDQTRLELPEERLRTIYGAVDAQSVHPGLEPADLRSEFGLPRQAFLIAYPARLVPKRRPLDLLRAAEALRPVLPEAHWMLIGRGPLERALRTEAERRGLWDRIHVVGYRPDFLHAVRAADLVVFLREGTDGGCRALLESMALARPVVTVDHGPLPELVAMGAAGVVVPDQNPRALAAEIVRLAFNPEERESLAAAARERVSAHFRPEQRVERTLQFYSDLLQRPRR